MLYIITSGNINQIQKSIKQKTSQKNNTKERPITLTRRIKKLIILPCQSFWPNMGVSIFFSHKPGAKEELPFFKIFILHKAAWIIPREYHQTGKYSTSKTASNNNRWKIMINIFLLLILYHKLMKIKKLTIIKTTNLMLAVSI